MVALVRSEALTCRMLLACTALHLCARMMQKLLIDLNSSDLLITFGARPERQRMAVRGQEIRCGSNTWMGLRDKIVIVFVA